MYDQLLMNYEKSVDFHLLRIHQRKLNKKLPHIGDLYLMRRIKQDL